MQSSSEIIEDIYSEKYEDEEIVEEDIPMASSSMSSAPKTKTATKPKA